MRELLWIDYARNLISVFVICPRIWALERIFSQNCYVIYWSTSVEIAHRHSLVLKTLNILIQDKTGDSEAVPIAGPEHSHLDRSNY